MNNEVKSADLVVYIGIGLSDVFFMLQELLLSKLIITHCLHRILQSKGIHHHVLGCDEERADSSKLKIGLWKNSCWFGVVIVHQFNGLEHKVLVLNLKLVDDFI